jgi:acetoin utilization deacetylase AcuC-like enzyme
MKIIFHPFMLEPYDGTPAGVPGRLESAVEILRKQRNYEFLEPPLATEEQILRVHSRDIMEQIQRKKRLSRMALLAAGGAVLAGEIAVKEEPVFALIRPPGHHASKDSHWGYCYYNNIAVSLLHLIAKGSINSAFILDFDLHTGDGNINILGDDKRFTVYNPNGNGDDQYLTDVKRALDDSPDVDIIVASAGFDQYVEDWGRNLSTDAFGKIGHLMYEFAEERCERRRYALLEGGYNFQDLGKNIFAFCEGLKGNRKK